MDGLLVERRFSVVCHFVSQSFSFKWFQVYLLSMNRTDGDCTAQQLDSIIQEQDIQSKVTDCVFDGGSYLLSCHKHLIEKVNCENLGYMRRTTGNCLSHVFSTAIGISLGSTEAESHGEAFF